MSDYFLADDLSGALDAAAGFHASGRPVRIVWSVEAWEAAPSGSVVGFTTETRNARADEAAATVQRIIEHGKGLGARLRYKKIDSTLRGPVAAELGALRAALPEVRVLFAPANPRVGRTVRDGVLLVDGVPVAATEFGRDPTCPVRESSIPALLGAAGRPPVDIADVQSEYDLSAAVTRMQRAGGDWIGVGSGALARPVAVARASSPGQQAPTPPVPRLAGPRLMICGSAHPANRDQAAGLSRLHGVLRCEVSVRHPRQAAPDAVAALRAHGAASLMLSAERTAPARALEAITIAAAEVIATAGVARLFVTGGETAFALCRQLGLSYLDFGAEIEPGLSLSMGSTAGRSFLLAIKPGGFGDVHTWIRAWQALDRP